MSSAAFSTSVLLCVLAAASLAGATAGTHNRPLESLDYRAQALLRARPAFTTKRLALPLPKHDGASSITQPKSQVIMISNYCTDNLTYIAATSFMSAGALPGIGWPSCSSKVWKERSVRSTPR